MLILKQYGVTLTRIQEKDIELIRYWRNQSDIVNFMEYKNYIFPEAQKKWFASIDNKLNYYFIIEFENKKIGLINVKNYDRIAGFGEGGIFIWDKNYIGSFAAVFSSLCLLNFMLLKVNVCSKSRVRILSNNDRAIHYNKLLGYKLLQDQEKEINQLYELDVKDYLLMGEKLNKAAQALADDTSLIYYGEVSEKNIDEINALLIRKTI
jgi:RimJ/RimL family protein N-acetyltransferase